MKRLISCAFILLATGCTTVGSIEKPEAYYSNDNGNQSEQLLGGSSGSDESLISGLLNHRLTLPSKIRIAIVKLNRNSRWRNYSSEFNDISEEIVAELIATLRRNQRVYDASYLPSMLIPRQHTVPILREAAARFQADLLLVYNESCRSYQKSRFIKSDLNKSYCVVEAVLLDTRSGVVAKSVVSLEEFESNKTTEDLNLREATRKAELSAIAKALGNIAREIDEFLARVPVS